LARIAWALASIALAAMLVPGQAIEKKSTAAALGGGVELGCCFERGVVMTLSFSGLHLVHHRQ
jgi:hypothetical protein